MRVSVDRDDPGFTPRRGAKIFLDGIEIKCVFTADEEGHFVVQAELGADGRAQLTDDRSAVKRITRYGDVRIEWELTEHRAAEDDIGVSITAVQRLKLEPGEVLVLHAKGRLYPQAAIQLREHMESFFPGNKCMVLDQDMRLEVATQEPQGQANA